MVRERSKRPFNPKYLLLLKDTNKTGKPAPSPGAFRIKFKNLFNRRKVHLSDRAISYVIEFKICAEYYHYDYYHYLLLAL